jgi:hypothetical protein
MIVVQATRDGLLRAIGLGILKGNEGRLGRIHL